MSTQQDHVLVVGSVAIDWVITPKDEREESIGGSGTFFSMAASYLSPVRLVGVVGHDFPDKAVQDLRDANVDIAGLEVVSDGLTFRWKGKYHENMNDRDTLETHLNVFEHFSPKLPEAFGATPQLFLANIQPTLQLEVLEKMTERPRFVGLDTMNLWIDIAADELRAVLGRIDCLMINEEEARQLTGRDNLVRAAREIRKMGPSTLIIKRGEYGALLFGPEDQVFSAPGLPLEEVTDPTGAGDSFAGGFMGYLAGRDASTENMRRGMIWGSVMASFCVEGFSYDGLRGLSQQQIDARFQRFIALTEFRR
jgi:sugar/nucleoside kinase (ribokinase family)